MLRPFRRWLLMNNYNEMLRGQAIRRIIKGQSIKEISKDLKISIPTLYSWRKKYLIDQFNDNNFLNNQRCSAKCELTFFNMKIF